MSRRRRENEEAIGVRKYFGEKFVSPAENRDADSMKTLRSLLSKQGENFVAKLKK